MCLDTGTSSRRLTTRRPITSFASSFSPAPSPSPPPEETKGGPNAFSVLMSGHKEKEQWKDAEIDLKRDGKRFAGRRKAPFYKVSRGRVMVPIRFRF
jgi:DNA cross-link repair 1A protein